MSKLKSEKYKGFNLKFSKLPNNRVAVDYKKGNKIGGDIGDNKEHAFKIAKYKIDLYLGNKEVYVKSRFSGWKKTSKKEALFYAKHMYKGITTMSGSKKVDYINNKLKGIKFTKSQLED